MSGAVDVSHRSLEYLLSWPTGGKAVMIVLGGAGEALNTTPNQTKLHLSKRKGFVRLALKQGYGSSDFVYLHYYGPRHVNAFYINQPIRSCSNAGRTLCPSSASARTTSLTTWRTPRGPLSAASRSPYLRLPFLLCSAPCPSEGRRGYRAG